MKRSAHRILASLLLVLWALALPLAALGRMQEAQVARLQELRPLEPLRFAVITDTHVPFDNLGLFLKLPHIFHELEVQFAVHCGDMVQVGDAHHFNTLLARLKRHRIPLLPTLGNHDTSYHDYDEWSVYTERIGDDYYYTDFGPVRLISLNTAPRADFDDEQLDWLEQALDTELMPIVRMHRPVPYAYPEFDGELDDLPQGVLGFKSLVESARVPLVLSGHLHRHMHIEIQGVEYVTSSGAGGIVRGHEGEYHEVIVVTVADGEAAFERVRVP